MGKKSGVVEELFGSRFRLTDPEIRTGYHSWIVTIEFDNAGYGSRQELVKNDDLKKLLEKNQFFLYFFEIMPIYLPIILIPNVVCDSTPKLNHF